MVFGPKIVLGFGPKIALVLKRGFPRNQNSLARKVAVGFQKVGFYPYTYTLVLFVLHRTWVSLFGVVYVPAHGHLPR
jgi:hypothetical protein